MGMAKTVKGHGAQRHLVSQMESVYEGLPEFDEQWAERIHQEGASFDNKYRNLGEYRAAASRASKFRRKNKPSTLAALKRLPSRFERGPRKRTLEKRQDQQAVKKERQLEGLQGCEL